MPSQLAKKIGNRIRELREQKGLSQDELAHRAGCHRTYIGMVERAEKSVGVERLSDIAHALQLKLSEFLRGID